MWSKFETSNNDEETLGPSFYANGLFKISNEAESAKNPIVKALIYNNRTFISVDKSFILLEDEISNDFNFLNFGSNIDCYAVSESGDLIVCCLNDGNIHGIYSKGIPVFNVVIDECEINLDKTFQDIIQIDNSYYILLTNGRIYHLSNIDEKPLSQSMVSLNENETCTMNETYIKNVCLELKTKTKIPRRVNSFTKVNTCEGELFVIATEGSIFLIQPSAKESCIPIPYVNGIKEVKKIIQLDNFIIGLTVDGNLVNICPYFYKIYKNKSSKFSNAIEDLVVLESTESYIELLVLSKTIEGDDRKMQIVEFPNCEIKYELDMPETTWLVTQPKSSMNMYFITGDKNSVGYVQSIEMKILSETDPVQRLKKLISKGFLDDAEKFAKEFDLDIEPIQEARVKKILMEMCSLTGNEEQIKKKFKSLMILLESFKDKAFLMEIRLHEIPDRNLMTKFLEFLLNNIDTNKYSEETNEINELLLRLETLRLIDPFECNMQWQKFLYNKDLIQAAIECFKNDVSLSNLIWARHSSSIIPFIQLDQFKKWLHSIPNSVEPFQIIQWMKHVVPCFLQTYPDEMSMFVDWSLDRTRALQHSKMWPDIGLEFITKIMEIFNDIKLIFTDVRQSYYKNSDKIQNLKSVLEELSLLKKNYKLILTLDDYMKESIEDTAFRLLQRVQMQNLKGIVNDFLYPIFNMKGMTPEKVIIRYIKFLCSNHSLGFWQERAVDAIDILNNEEDKLRCALQVLKLSPVPWSEAVNPLIRLGNASSHPLANDIIIEYKSQALKIIKTKYNWPYDYFNVYNDKIKLVYRILKLKQPDMVEDIHVLVETTPDIANDAYFYLINRLMELNDVEACMDVIKKMKEENRNKFFQTTINVFIQRIDEGSISQEKISNYLEVMKLLHNQLNFTGSNEFLIKQIQESIEKLKVLWLRENFQLSISCKDLEKASKREEHLEEIILKMVDKLQNMEGNIIDDILRQSAILSDCFKISILHIFYNICHKLGNLHFTCYIVDYINRFILIEGNEQKYAINLATLLMVQQTKYFDENASDDLYDPLSFPLVFELMRTCSLNLKVLRSDKIGELLRWSGIPREFYKLDVLETTRKTRIVDKSIILRSKAGSKSSRDKRRESFSVFEVFDEKKFVKDNPFKADSENIQAVLRCVCKALKIVAFGLSYKGSIFDMFRELFGEETDIQSITDTFFGSLENLLKNKLHSPVSSIIQHLIKLQNGSEKVVIPVVFASTLNKRIMKFILSQKNPNYMDALLVLKSEENAEECLKYLEGALKNNSQKIAFSTFSEMFNSTLGNDSKSSGERENRLKYYYFTELCKYDSSAKFKTSRDSSVIEIAKVLCTYVLDIDLIKKIAKDFNWDNQLLLAQQIKNLLSNQELKFEVKTDVFGKDEVIIETSVDQIKKLCEPYLHEISNNEFLAKKLKNYLNEINSYFYELYLCVLSILEYINYLSSDLKIWENILLFLKHKMTVKRRKIAQLETDYWLQTQSDVGVLPNISKYRLPFKPLVENPLETILNDEICVDNYEKWLPLMGMHSMLLKYNVSEKQEYFCMAAVKNSIAEYKDVSDCSKNDKWNLKPLNNSFLQSVLRIIKYMSDPSKVIFILYFVTNHAPEGCDQVEAAYECYKFGVQHETELAQNPKSCEVLMKIKRKFPIIKTQHLLHLYGLEDGKLFQLVENPTELINALYHHESILQAQKKDINKLVFELAELNNINLMLIQMNLLQKWLAFADNREEVDINETVYEDFISVSQDNDDNGSINDESVARAHYILSSWNRTAAMDFLAGELLSEKSSPENQLQLMECFAKLVDDKFSFQENLVNPVDFLVLKCCFYLKQLGLNFTSGKFMQTDKLSLLKSIWTNHLNNPKALELMCLICLGYNIHLPQIWNGILKQMVKMNMIAYLSTLVEILSTKSNLLHLSNLKSAWECVIREPFVTATKQHSAEQESKLAKSLILLQKCPISTYLNLMEFVEHCIRIERPHMAAFFVAFVKIDDRPKFVKLLQPFINKSLKKDIVDLEELGVAPIVTKSVIDLLF